jgi:hypothetical protein
MSIYQDELSVWSTGRDERGPYVYTFEELKQTFYAYGMPLAID